MSTLVKERLTAAEYLAFERRSEVKHEFLNGEIFAHAGASRKHCRVGGNVFASLHHQLRGRPCEAFMGDMRVRVSVTGLYTYPDIAVVCGEPEFEDDELDTLLNPTLIIEVLSDSTADYDRGTKFAHYRTLPSLREYLLFAQDRVHVEHFVRQPEDRWLLTESDDPASILDLEAIGCKLELAAAYERVVSTHQD